MTEKKLRVVFFSQEGASAESVPTIRTKRCSVCQAARETRLTAEEADEIGAEAADVIYAHAHGCWYDGLIRRLVGHSPNRFEEALRRVRAE